MKILDGLKWKLASSGRGATVIKGVVLHWTASKTLSSALSWMSTARKGSYHYVIDVDGVVTKCVPTSRKAWHTGRDGKRANLCPKDEGVAEGIANEVSIGISFVNPGDKTPLTSRQIESVKTLVDMLKHFIPTLDWITTHHECCPSARPTELLMEYTQWDWKIASQWSGLKVWTRPKNLG